MRRAMTERPPSATDVLIVGAGIAGASLAAALAPSRRVVLTEAEDAPGYHATGRSEAFRHDTYGGSGVQPPTLPSPDALLRLDTQFSSHSFLATRPPLTLRPALEPAP